MWEARVEANTISYNAGISACEKGEQWQRALALLSEMWAAKVEPSVSATMLESARARRASNGNGRWRCWERCGRRRWRPTHQLQRCDQRVREMRAVAASAGAAQRDVGGEGEAQRHQLQRWDQREREGQAVAAGVGAAQRDERGEAGAEFSYNTGISACEKGRQWQRALALLSEMWEARVERSIVSYGSGISACGNGEQWRQALALLSEVWEARVGLDVSAAALGSARARRASSGSGRLRF
ncbi:unnamed protein product [Prorocentrum cordatum]|nr:unnamed protein product [Polarella glacialis]